MPDSPVVHIGENSPEGVAFKLFTEVVLVEIHNAGQKSKMTKKWILDTYAECLMSVRAPGSRLKE
jgi:hypothetical protein